MVFEAAITDCRPGVAALDFGTDKRKRTVALSVRALVLTAGKQDPAPEQRFVDRDRLRLVEKAAQSRVLEDLAQILALRQPLVAFLAAQLLGFTVFLQEPGIADQLTVDLKRAHLQQQHERQPMRVLAYRL